MLHESEESPHDRPVGSGTLSPTGGFTLAVQAFDQAIGELADEVLSRCPDGRASVEACLRQRCARLVDQQLEAFREHADRREQQHLVRREERNEAVRKTLQMVEQQHQEAMQVTAARHQEGLQAATAVARSEAAAEAAAVAEKRLEAKLAEASSAAGARLETKLAEAAAAASKKLDARLQEAAAAAQEEVERRTREAVTAVREEVEQRAKEAASQAAAATGAKLREASQLAEAKLSEAMARARCNRLEAVSATMARHEVWHVGSSAHLVFLLWRSSSKRARASNMPEAREPKLAEKVIDDRIDTKGSLMKHIYSDKSSSENEPPRNGQAPSHPQGPPPAHQPTRPVLRSVRSDGSMTPARPGTAPLVEPPPTMTQPLAPATGILPHAQGTASPSILCRVDGSRQPHLGEHAGNHQHSTGSLPPATGDVAAWGAAVRAQSTERQCPYRQASPTPRSRPPALASPGVPLAPPHIQQQAQALAVGQQTPTTAGYRAVQAPPASYGSGAVGRSVTPRSQPPSCAVQMMTAPTAAWQASGPGLVASTPRGLSPCTPFVEVPKQQGSGSFVAAAPPVGQTKPQGSGSFVAAPPSHKPSTTVHGFAAGHCPQRAASGPTNSAPPGPLATQPALSQLQSPPQGSSQVARLRQGSPLSRSRTVDWNGGQPSAQAYVRPHSAWGHM